MPVLNTYRLGGLTPTKTEHTKSKGWGLNHTNEMEGWGVRKYKKGWMGQIQTKGDENGVKQNKG